MNKLLSFMFTILLLFTMGCDQEDMPIIGGDIVGPTDLVGCEGANMYDWNDFQFETSLDQGETVWIGFDLQETTLFNVVIDQAGFHCVIFNGCVGEMGNPPPIFDFESIGNGQEVGILTEGTYYMEITNTRNRVDFTFSIALNEILYGCLNDDAVNYCSDRNVDDGSCVLQDCTVDYYITAYDAYASEVYFPMINDCDGNCTPESWVGDGWCDDGAYAIWGPGDEAVPVNLMCTELQWDLGDCEEIPEGCTTGLIEDCNDICAPEGWLGDGYCDEGSYEYNGNPIFFNCEEFNNDNGDCDEGLNRQMQQPKYPNGRILIGQ